MGEEEPSLQISKIFLEINMNFPYQIRKILMTIGLVVILATVITFSFAPGKSWANPLVTPRIDQSHALVATINQAKATAKKIEGKAQEEIGNMTGDLNAQAAGKAKQFEANTQEAILESIDNPNYQPEGQGLRKRDREAVKCLEDDVSDCFNQTQGPD
jgi:uncharacterized protein YjbJ (UPF0337 family)